MLVENPAHRLSPPDRERWAGDGARFRFRGSRIGFRRCANGSPVDARTAALRQAEERRDQVSDEFGRVWTMADSAGGGSVGKVLKSRNRKSVSAHPPAQLTSRGSSGFENCSEVGNQAAEASWMRSSSNSTPSLTTCRPCGVRRSMKAITPSRRSSMSMCAGIHRRLCGRLGLFNRFAIGVRIDGETVIGAKPEVDLDDVFAHGAPRAIRIARSGEDRLAFWRSRRRRVAARTADRTPRHLACARAP